MSTVDLTDQEWGQIMNILAEAPWKVSNPLLMKIGNQLRAQAQPPTAETIDMARRFNSGDKGEQDERSH
jgi:hypothetical protein